MKVVDPPSTRGVTVDLSIRLSNGNYQSTLSIPLNVDPADGERQIVEWLGMQSRYLQAHRTGDAINVRHRGPLGTHDNTESNVKEE